ncbi:glycoside hydrolase family 3 N-terminal domain-containing protein [Nocardioides sp.]|uniref:glycoside hydrolase family 3 N-terminal domain-containing protein n=1 Tax=Nocardioides sp. TaxID=35761 RepID=UPI0025D9065E|nr:glycoside hydrolase family 3 N-terminal domain-containing protein [Nocardioides sp.]
MHTDGTVYRDLNGNGVMDPYEDPRRSIDERVDDLVRRLSLREKAGLMFQTVVPVTVDGELDGRAISPRSLSARDLVADRQITHLNVHQIPAPRAMAHWVNQIQLLAAESPHGIPVTISSDPRHSFTENLGASFSAGDLSAWPEPLGLGALADEQAVREFADIARREYLALGIRMALHPTLDVATEPRWPRQYSTFGQNAEIVSRLGLAYLDGFEAGQGVTAESVACMAKHFPGGGPQRGGEDPHFPYGKEQDYPGGQFEYHLAPFRRAIERGVSAIMPGYGVPIGLEYAGERIEEVAFGFNRQIITGLLREELGYDGVICTDWGLVTESKIGGKTLPPRSWGVEHLTEPERVRRIIEAGCDQLGGEDDPELIVSLVESGQVPISAIDRSVRRLLEVKFQLGLFDDPFVDEDTAEQIVGMADFDKAGRRAQSRSMIVLSAGRRSAPALPLAKGFAVYSEEVSAGALVDSGLRPADNPDDADVIVVRTKAPFEPRDTYMLEASFHAGSLEFSPEFEHRLREYRALAPVILAVRLDRPAILEPLIPHCSALVAEFGASDAALLDVLTGQVPAEGKLPFDVPRSMAAIETSRPDAAGDTVRPLLLEGQASAPIARRAGRRIYAQGRESREMILETALAVIERKGYSTTSLRDIASEAGMTQAGLLHHFGTKENLLVEVLRQRDIVDRRDLALLPGDEPMTIRTARHNVTVPGLIHLYVSLEAAAVDPEHPAHEFFLERERDVLAAVRRDVEARQRVGDFRVDVDPAMVARVLVAASDGLQTAWEIDRDAVDLPGTIEWLWNQLAGTPSANENPHNGEVG